MVPSEKLKEKKRSTIEVAGVFDIETQGWDKFVCGCLYMSNGEKFVFDYREEDRLVDKILETEGNIWAHNGGRYDALWLLDHVAKRGLEADVFAAGTRIVRARVGKLNIMDSAALAPMSLATFAQIAGEKKTETGFSCVCGLHCGGYCAITRDMRLSDLNQTKEYMVNDCVVTLKSLRKLVEYAEENDLDLRGTIGASAWGSASRWCALGNAEWRMGQYNFARSGYYGGRSQVFRPSAKAGYRYDINSAYPAALAHTSLPSGKREILVGEEASRAFSSGREGIYKALVKVPESFIPPLPTRVKIPKESSDGKNTTSQGIGYPVGEFVGTWTRLELDYALRLGAVVQRITNAIVWSDSARVLEPFAQRVWDLRAKEGKKSALGKWLKLYANSLTGKLAQNPDREKVVMNPDLDSVSCTADGECHDRFCGLIGKCCKHKCIGKCGGWKRMGYGMRLWTCQQYQIGSCAHVQYAAYLTAAARTELHAQLIDDGVGGETAVYCDTDSVYSMSNRVKSMGDELGEWLYEGRFSNFKSLAPKVYSYIDPDTGEFCARAKGIPEADNPSTWQKIETHSEIAITRGVQTFKTAARAGNLFARKNTHRQIRADGFYFGDRILDGPVTRPRDARELRGL